MRVIWMSTLLFFSHSAMAANYGDAMPAGEVQDIAAAIAKNSSAQEVTGKFSGRITQVCQKEGCWLVIESNGRAARVEMKDHAFVVPKKARGSAIAYGVLSQVELDAEEAEHLAKDAGQEAKPVANSEWQILASAIEINK